MARDPQHNVRGKQSGPIYTKLVFSVELYPERFRGVIFGYRDMNTVYSFLFLSLKHFLFFTFTKKIIFLGGWAGWTLALSFHWSFASRAVCDDPFASVGVGIAAALHQAENPGLGPVEESRYRLDESIIVCIFLPK